MYCVPSISVPWSKYGPLLPNFFKNNIVHILTFKHFYMIMN